MEQHPVPRNITGFQFRLIGDMTLKQFGYILAGGVLAVIFIKLPFPIYFGWPLGVGSFLAGLAFAFVPIQERPLDLWFLAFIRSIYSPTQFIWHKQNPPPSILFTKIIKSRKRKKSSTTMAKHYQQSRKKLNAYLKTLPKSAGDAANKRENKQLREILSLFSTATFQPPQVATTITPPPVKKPSRQPPPPVRRSPAEKQIKEQPVPTKSLSKKETPKIEVEAATDKSAQEIENKTKKITEQIGHLKKELQVEKVDQARIKELESQFSQLLGERDRLMKELAELREQLAKKKEVIRPTSFKEEEQGKETVKIILPKIAKAEGFPSIPQVPNIISGIVKNSSGTLLPNILIIIRDNSNTPVRALKTNKLGQFAASTPLPAGTYTLKCEDPQKKYSFAIIEITLTDDLVTPLEITAKSEKDIRRDKLMKEIFGENYQKTSKNGQRKDIN